MFRLESQIITVISEVEKKTFQQIVEPLILSCCDPADEIEVVHHRYDVGTGYGEKQCLLFILQDDLKAKIDFLRPVSSFFTCMSLERVDVIQKPRYLFESS